MSWFQLDPESVLRRVEASGSRPTVPGLGASIIRGVIGFTLLSVAGFAPWAVGGRWFHKHFGEVGMYLACTLTFIGLSGPLLHRLILGRGSLVRFYKLFGITFAAYAVLWIVGWMALRGNSGSLAGLFLGTAVMAWMLAEAFDARGAAIRAFAALFVLNSVGYFAGGWIEGAVAGTKSLSILGQTLSKQTQMAVAGLLWGVGYGIGFGAGLGVAFHLCQERVRAALRTLTQTAGS